MLGYEGSYGYDPAQKMIIRWGGHTQSGGHEQMNETWTIDPFTLEFKLLETNTAPPGVCCAQQDIFDPDGGRFLRFRAFSGSHGWHWFRENYLSNSSVWSLDPVRQEWRNMRPIPEPVVAPLRCASWDSDQHVAVVFGGEGSSDGTVVYDPYENTWTRKNPKVEPAFRSGGNMVYDSHRKRHVLFGGQFLDDPHTWAYDLAKNEWTDLKPAVQPPTKANDAVMAYDVGNDVIVASIKTGSDDDGRYETWVFDGAANTWKNMATKDGPPGHGARRRIMVYVPDLNVVVMENYVNPSQKIAGTDREQQIWTYRYAETKSPVKVAAKEPFRSRPPLVDGIVASVLDAKHVKVAWQPSRAAGVVGYHVERAVVDAFSEDEIVRLRKDTPPLAEPSIGGIRAIGAFRRLTDKPIAVPTFEDVGLDLTKPAEVEGKPIFLHRFGKDQVNASGKKYRFAVYAYRVPHAVDRQGSRKRPEPIRADDPVRAGATILEGDGRRLPSALAEEPRGGDPGIPHLPNGVAADQRRGAEGDSRDGAPDRGDRVSRQGNRQGPAPLLGRGRRCSRSGGAAVRADLALPPVPVLLRTLHARVAPVSEKLAVSSSSPGRERGCRKDCRPARTAR